MIQPLELKVLCRTSIKQGLDNVITSKSPPSSSMLLGIPRSSFTSPSLRFLTYFLGCVFHDRLRLTLATLASSANLGHQLRCALSDHGMWQEVPQPAHAAIHTKARIVSRKQKAEFRLVSHRQSVELEHPAHHECDLSSLVLLSQINNTALPLLMVSSHASGAYHNDASLSDDPPTTENKSPVLNDSLKAFLEPARNLRWVVDLYCNIQMVFLNGNTIIEHLSDEDLEYDYEADAIADLAKSRNGDVHAYHNDWRIFNTILDIIPGLRECYDNMPDLDVLLKLAKEMNERANNGQATDAHSLKEAIKIYIPDWSPSVTDLYDTKAQRGFNHIQYTKQLILA
ncbi:hypothetical protein HETIRDRAFT_422261 [Heterobasidion irregulare TC 32-1]|uniref:Uncharacterized protein n=1 Tax=Heterobasidion irregulare (strain TC 32-1) TaxID=747525 RepID=W4JTP4_HETIT|nr:uncharacterized protein HETIRDRAFT_422261 [Heterobasidion irregulare TC 32-1]ETW76908.1 hypothetical protein HETIRDRAFT_422261 [Heterobasidion irregulare TC 32-1]